MSFHMPNCFNCGRPMMFACHDCDSPELAAAHREIANRKQAWKEFLARAGDTPAEYSKDDLYLKLRAAQERADEAEAARDRLEKNLRDARTARDMSRALRKKLQARVKELEAIELRAPDGKGGYKP